MAINSPLRFQNLVDVAGGCAVAAAAEPYERQSPAASACSSETRLDRLSGDLRYGNTTAPRFAAKGGCESFG